MSDFHEPDKPGPLLTMTEVSQLEIGVLVDVLWPNQLEPIRYVIEHGPGGQVLGRIQGDEKPTVSLSSVAVGPSPLTEIRPAAPYF